MPKIRDCEGFGLTPLMDNGILYSQYPSESAKSVTDADRNVMSDSLLILIKVKFSKSNEIIAFRFYQNYGLGQYFPFPGMIFLIPPCGSDTSPSLRGIR